MYISYWTWGFSNVMLVFRGVTAGTQTFFGGLGGCVSFSIWEKKGRLVPVVSFRGSTVDYCWWFRNLTKPGLKKSSISFCHRASYYLNWVAIFLNHQEQGVLQWTKKSGWWNLPDYIFSTWGLFFCVESTDFPLYLQSLKTFPHLCRTDWVKTRFLLTCCLHKPHQKSHWSVDADSPFAMIEIQILKTKTHQFSSNLNKTGTYQNYPQTTHGWFHHPTHPIIQPPSRQWICL